MVNVGSSVRSLRGRSTGGACAASAACASTALRERAPQAAVEHQALEHVARDVRAAERAHHPRAALSPAEQHEIADPGAGATAAVERHPAAALEHGLGHGEAAALREHGDQRRIALAHLSLPSRVRSATGRASSRFVFGLSFAFTWGSIPSPARFSPFGR